MLSEEVKVTIAWTGLVVLLFCLGAIAGVGMAWIQRRAMKRVDKITLLDGLMREYLGVSLASTREALRAGGHAWQSYNAARVFWMRYRGARGMMQHRGRREETRAAMVEAERALDALFGVRMPPSAPVSQPDIGVRARGAAAEESEVACG